MGPTDDGRHTCLRAMRLDRPVLSRWLPSMPRRCGRVGHPPKLRSSIEGGIMQASLPEVYLARHGETAWTISGQHTGRTDIPLTARGENTARRLGERLKLLSFAHVLTSPLRRATRTCELTGYGNVAESNTNLLEWNYGAYEGLTSEEIHAINPDWDLFRDGCPNGETPGDVAARADRTIQRVRAVHDDVLLFSSGHFLRV